MGRPTREATRLPEPRPPATPVRHPLPRGVRIGDKTPRGYDRGDFLDAWARYTPAPPSETAQHPQQAQRPGSDDLASVAPVAVGTAAVADRPIPAQVAAVADVADLDRTGARPSCAACGQPMIVVEPGQSTHPAARCRSAPIQLSAPADTLSTNTEENPSWPASPPPPDRAEPADLPGRSDARAAPARRLPWRIDDDLVDTYQRLAADRDREFKHRNTFHQAAASTPSMSRPGPDPVAGRAARRHRRPRQPGRLPAADGAAAAAPEVGRREDFWVHMQIEAEARVLSTRLSPANEGSAPTRPGADLPGAAAGSVRDRLRRIDPEGYSKQLRLCPSRCLAGTRQCSPSRP